jgi:mono/diheme cytochrome c family protein
MPRRKLSMFRFPASRILAACSIAAMAFGVGCAKNPDAQFSWRDSTEQLIPDARKTVHKTLTETFGTPQNLVAWGRMPVNYGGTPPGAAVQAEPEAEPAPVADTGEFGHRLQLGRQVYMKNCLHCHGVAGDGAGPTARYLNPKPRDYRLGLFKFTSTLAPERATRDDLHRIVKYGIPGTYMPSFLLLGEPETVAVVEYVRWLAMRGELEKRIDDELADYSLKSIDDEITKARNAYESVQKSGEKPEAVPSRSALTKKASEDFKTYLAEDFSSALDGTADFIAENWTRADEDGSRIVPKVVRVADTVESRDRGRLLYLSDKTKCYTCHGHTGRGNGPATEDFWPKPGSTEKFAKRGLHDVWENPLPPRNLRLGQYRGGRRPIDVFARIYAGIKGTPMPAFGGTVLKDEDIWDVVNYVMSLPYEPETPSAAPAKTEHVAATETRH